MWFIIAIIMFYWLIFYMPWWDANRQARNRARKMGKDTYTDPSGATRDVKTGKFDGSYDLNQIEYRQKFLNSLEGIISEEEFQRRQELIDVSRQTHQNLVDSGYYNK